MSARITVLDGYQVDLTLSQDEFNTNVHRWHILYHSVIFLYEALF